MPVATERKPPLAYEPVGRFTARTPSGQFKGVRAGVRFLDGVGHTDDATAAAELRLLGYAVSDARPDPPPADGSADPPAQPQAHARRGGTKGS